MIDTSIRETLPTPGDTGWFVHDRFGLFIHWGLYSLAARHEWLKAIEKMSDDVYDKYFQHFDPDLYDPNLWASAAANAGMKYFVVTTKHHEGFCLWDTRLTNYKAPNAPAGRDLLRPMIEAFRAKDMRVGLYHSLIDWHHPDFVIDTVYGPLHDHPDRVRLNEGRDQARYADYLHAQVRELLSEYGKIDVLWFDFSYPKEGGGGKGRADWKSEDLYALVRELMPDVVLNDRLNLETGWDIKTPEQYQPAEWVTVNGQKVVWEACQTFSGSWGYHRDESSWKTTEQLIHMLIDSVSKGGNLLLNVGPTGRGEFDERALDRLNGIGEWMKRHNRAIYGCTQAPPEFIAPPDCRLTYNPETNRMYVHVFAWPFVDLHLQGFAGKIAYAQLLNDASEVLFEEHLTGQQPNAAEHMTAIRLANSATLHLPVQQPKVAVPVIELFLK